MRNIKLLIVEKDDASKKIISEALSTEYDLCFAESNEELSSLYKSNDDIFSAILVDISENGEESVKAFKAMKTLNLVKNVPIIVISDNLSETLAEELCEIGIISYINKPLRKFDIILTVRNYMNYFRFKRTSEVSANEFVLEYFCESNSFLLLNTRSGFGYGMNFYSPEVILSMVYPSDRKKFLKTLSRVQDSPVQEKLSARFRVGTAEEGYIWYETSFIAAINSVNSKKSIIISAYDVQELHDKEAEINDKTAMLNIVSSAISNYFRGTYIVNLALDSVNVIATSDLFPENFGETENFSNRIEEYCNNDITEDYKEVFRRCAQYDNIINHLDDGIIVDCLYRIEGGSWINLRIYKTEQYTHTNPVTLWIFEDANDRHTQYEIQRQLRTEIKKGYKENAKLKVLAHTDALTGMFNETAFTEEVTKKLQEKHSGLFMMIDGDSFKAVNDKYGHMIGDRVIITVADAIQRRIRNYDVASRLHGDEFAIWVEGTTDQIIAEKITDDINEIIKSISAQERLPVVTISSGFTPALPGDTYSALYERADSNLCKVKQMRHTM